ncbi:MAG: extracellular solute-binding protein [Lachnospiraceae bacterium]|nr:extracellular solute-binding protein [Lachnospiraceae bacterium]
MLRLLRMLILILIIIPVLAACTPTDNTEDTAAKEKCENLLIWSYYETEAQSTGLDQIIDAFNASQDKYSASWEYVPMSEFDKRIARAYTEQELPDIVIIDNPDMQKFIQMDMFEDISNYAKTLDLENSYYSSAVSTVRYNGKYYGVPFNSNNVCLIYRPDLLAKYNVEVPESWDEFDEAAHALTKDGNFGFLMSTIDSEQGAFQLMSWIMAASESETSVDASAISDTFTLLCKLTNDGCMSVDCMNYNQNDVARRFIKGDIAMMENGPWVLPLLNSYGIDYALAPMPYYKRNAVILGGENLGIVKGKNVDGAIEFIKFCMETGEVEKFCKYSALLPGRIAAAEELTAKMPELSVIKAQMDYSIARPCIKDYGSISSHLTSLFNSTITGDITPEKAAENILYK